jgi:hypothetical protein
MIRRYGMTETCWFCKKNPADATKTIELKIHQVIDSSTTYGTQYVAPTIKNMTQQTVTHYNTGKIDILRCKECAEIHEINHMKYIKAEKTKPKIVAVGTLIGTGIVSLFNLERLDTSVLCAIAVVVGIVTLSLMRISAWHFFIICFGVPVPMCWLPKPRQFSPHQCSN